MYCLLGLNQHQQYILVERVGFEPTFSTTATIIQGISLPRYLSISCFLHRLKGLNLSHPRFWRPGARHCASLCVILYLGRESNPHSLNGYWILLTTMVFTTSITITVCSLDFTFILIKRMDTIKSLHLPYY